jgi:formylglycine-generating enzyme required for sulfatase activity
MPSRIAVARRVVAAACAVGALVAASMWFGREDRDATATALDRDMVRVPAGWFVMGSDAGEPDELPVRRVWVGAFAIDRFEVTNLQYRRFLEATDRPAPRYWEGGDYPSGTALDPVVGVGWRDACDYCAWVGERLPTEAEWEKACRGTDGRTFPWGDRWEPRRANVWSVRVAHLDDAWALVPSHSGPGLRPVDAFPGGVGPYGTHGMVGNAAEWVADRYDPDGYAGWPLVDAIGTGPSPNHSIRGGPWLDPFATPGSLERAGRCAERNSSHSYDDPRVGFRCATSLSATREPSSAVGDPHDSSMRAPGTTETHGRSGNSMALAFAIATVLPSASSIVAVATAMARPRRATVARATRSRQSGVTGRRKFTFMSSVAKQVRGGSVVVIAPLSAPSARYASAPPEKNPTAHCHHGLAGIAHVEASACVSIATSPVR